MNWWLVFSVALGVLLAMWVHGLMGKAAPDKNALRQTIARAILDVEEAKRVMRDRETHCNAWLKRSEQHEQTKDEWDKHTRALEFYNKQLKDLIGEVR